MRTDMSLCQRLGILVPIIQAGMAGGPTTSELIVKVSQSGALGTLGAGYLSPSQIRTTVSDLKTMLKVPFAVNLFVLDSIPDNLDGLSVQEAVEAVQPFRTELHLNSAVAITAPTFSWQEQFQAILDVCPPIVSFTFGKLTAEQMTELQARGIVAIGTATTVEEAVLLDELGVDVIIAQGSEAGGHRGTFVGSFESGLIGVLSLVPQVVDAVSKPVVAAGGIMDGRQMAAAMALGAAGVQMGTAFLTTPEAGTNPAHREAILSSRDTSTRVTDVFSGKPARALQNKFMEHMTVAKAPILPYPVQNTLTRELRKEAAKYGLAELMSLWAGQSSPMARVCPASELITKIMNEYRLTVAELANRF